MYMVACKFGCMVSFVLNLLLAVLLALTLGKCSQFAHICIIPLIRAVGCRQYLSFGCLALVLYCFERKAQILHDLSNRFAA